MIVERALPGLFVVLTACGGEPRGAARVEAASGATTEVQVVPWAGGEQLLLGRRAAPLSIKVGPRSGSPTLIMGSEEIAAGDGIPVHMHMTEDEILFIHSGDAIATVGDREEPVTAGTTIFVPRGTWHGMRNADDATAPVQLLWIFSAPGMDDYFRGIGRPPGGAPPDLDAVAESALETKHGIRYRP